MKTCKIAVFHGPGEPLEVRETAIPELQEGELLVRNEFTTLCRSDLTTFTGKRTEKTPTILGHEIVGRIVEFGPGAPRQDIRGTFLSAGNRITWGIYASDPESMLARRGIPQKGTDLFKYGHEQVTESSSLHGGLADYTILRANTPIIKIGEQIPVSVAALVNCSVATVAGALRLAGALRERTVLIPGSGMLGTMACAMSKWKGAARVIAVDIDANRPVQIKQFGAAEIYWIGRESQTTLRKELGKKRKVDVVIELSGAATAMEQSLEVLNIGGTAIWVGATFPQRKVYLDAEQVVRNLWTIKGLHNYNERDLHEAVRFVEEQHANYPFATLVKDHFDLEHAELAFDYALRENPYRVGLDLR